MYPKLHLRQIVPYNGVQYSVEDILTEDLEVKYDLREVEGDGELLGVREVDIIYHCFNEVVKVFDHYLDNQYDRGCFDASDPHDNELDKFLEIMKHIAV